MSLSNNVEMKVKSDQDSTGVKKISLIENFTISQSYNFAADSLRWSNVNTSLSLRLVKTSTSTFRRRGIHTPTSSMRLARRCASTCRDGKPTRMGETVEHGNFVQLHAQQLHFQAQEEILVDRLQKDRLPRRQSGRDGRRNGRTEQPEKDDNLELDSDGYAHWSFLGA